MLNFCYVGLMQFWIDNQFMTDESVIFTKKDFMLISCYVEMMLFWLDNELLHKLFLYSIHVMSE